MKIVTRENRLFSTKEDDSSFFSILTRFTQLTDYQGITYITISPSSFTHPLKSLFILLACSTIDPVVAQPSTLWLSNQTFQTPKKGLARFVCKAFLIVLINFFVLFQRKSCTIFMHSVLHILRFDKHSIYAIPKAFFSFSLPRIVHCF